MYALTSKMGPSVCEASPDLSGHLYKSDRYKSVIGWIVLPLSSLALALEHICKHEDL